MLRSLHGCILYNCLLYKYLPLRQQDNQSLAMVSPRESSRLLPLMNEGTVYYISNFRIVVSTSRWRPETTERALIFTQQTAVLSCYDGSSIAKTKFDLCPLPAISTDFGKNSGLLGTPLHSLLQFFYYILRA